MTIQQVIPKIGAIVVGAGRGERIGTDKMFLPLANKPLLAWSVDIFQDYSSIKQIIIVLNKNNLNSGQKLVADRRWAKVAALCLGGKRRQDSVMEGLKRLESCEWVVVHDGARPFLTHALLDAGLKAAEETGASAAAIPLKDTVKLTDDNRIVTETLDRSRLWSTQTPQVFRFDIIIKAYKHNNDNVTDDASLVEKYGGKIKLFMGSYDNIKITTAEDLILAQLIAERR
ncbi:2-C-methyl-D-erythritol 4-phosphate cytidylyltransferase [Chloroflexota bacterium]